MSPRACVHAYALHGSPPLILVSWLQRLPDAFPYTLHPRASSTASGTDGCPLCDPNRPETQGRGGYIGAATAHSCFV